MNEGVNTNIFIRDHCVAFSEEKKVSTRRNMSTHAVACQYTSYLTVFRFLNQFERVNQ